MNTAAQYADALTLATVGQKIADPVFATAFLGFTEALRQSMESSPGADESDTMTRKAFTLCLASADEAEPDARRKAAELLRHAADLVEGA